MSFNTEALNTIYKLKKEILKSDNETLVSQIDHAIMKTYNDQLVMSFIGHYSAGKSSLINYLLKKEILPSSPVPTTSNTVQVQVSTDENIQAFLNQYQYVPLDNYDELKRLNTKDIDITAINMDIVHDDFNHRTVFQDTPGVDSKTDAHEETTNRFLLNSDYIFFTVEYNHVQSEHNLKMLKNISDLNIPVSLIINQVDKHDDSELSFETFLSRIKETISDWGIRLENIFTTSIYSSPYNEIESLKSFIHSLESEKDRIQDSFYQRITANIEREQIEYLQSELEDISSRLDTDAPLTHDKCTSQIKFLDGEIEKNNVNALHQDKDVLKSHVTDSVKKIVKDSYIFPHEVKAAITEYLKIRAGEVKAGGLFGRKKKEAQLLKDARENINRQFDSVISTEINAPVNSYFSNIGLTGRPFKYTWSNENLDDSGIPSISSSFIMNYLDKLKSFLVKDVSKAAVSHTDILTYSNTESTKDRKHLIEERKLYQEALNLFNLIESIDTMNYRHFYIHMDDEIEKLDLTEAVTLDLDESEDSLDQERRDFQLEYEEKFDLSLIMKIKNIIDNVPRYNDFSRVLDDKLQRLKKGRANISVFGGFSAGKTTFINALMGENRLTTSPNPTTATITEINGHDSSRVTYKNEVDLIETLSTLSNLEYSHIKDYTKWIKKNAGTVPETYKPFLNGILNHLQEYEDNLGKTVEIDTDELIQKISTDEDATFIHKADVSIKNDLTRRYNLIDSPGINSVNQRHTKETRNIIADSDLVIYVSYYNHVFSRSDESFLKYIRSIKGKDFPIIFIINAVDLMKDESDREKVMRYMSDALIGMEINHVIYPVSSKNALNNDDADFNAAKENIIKIADDHVKMVQYHSLTETAGQLLSRIQSNIRQYEDRESEQSRLMSKRTALTSSLSTLHAKNVSPKLFQEIDVVLSFIKKRFELKLYDYLKGLITAADAVEKNYLTKHESIFSRRINDFLTLETSIVFNSVYRLADDLLVQLVSEYNDELKDAGTAHTLSVPETDGSEPQITVEASRFKDFSKTLYQTKKNTRDFRNTLLELSGSLIDSIHMESLETEMQQLINHYLEEKDRHLTPEIQTILTELTMPLQEIKETDYQEDRKLLKSLKQIEGESNDLK